MNKKEITTLLHEYGYAEILRQAVAEIHTARATIARQVSSATNSVYWNLGKLRWAIL